MHCLAPAWLPTSANRHSEEMPPAYQSSWKVGAVAKGNKKKVLQICDSVQPAKLCVMGESQPFTVTEHGAMKGPDGSFLTDETSLHFGFCLIKGGVLITTRSALDSDGEISPPRDASFLGASGDTGHIKYVQMPLQWQLS